MLNLYFYSYNRGRSKECLQAFDLTEATATARRYCYNDCEIFGHIPAGVRNMETAELTWDVPYKPVDYEAPNAYNLMCNLPSWGPWVSRFRGRGEINSRSVVLRVNRDLFVGSMEYRGSLVFLIEPRARRHRLKIRPGIFLGGNTPVLGPLVPESEVKTFAGALPAGGTAACRYLWSYVESFAAALAPTRNTNCRVLMIERLYSRCYPHNMPRWTRALRQSSANDLSYASAAMRSIRNSTHPFVMAEGLGKLLTNQPMNWDRGTKTQTWRY